MRWTCWAAAGGGLRAVTAEDVVEAGVGAVDRAGVLEEARFVVQREDQAVDLEQHLLFVDVGAQVAFLLGLQMARFMAACQVMHRAGQRVAHRARPVVELHRAADVDAARIDFDRGALHPVGEHGAQARQAARLLQRRVEHLFLEALVVLADHRDLQFLARAEVGEHARLAHLRDLGQRADGQAFQADLRGQAQRRVDDGGLGLLAFLQGPAFARVRAA